MLTQLSIRNIALIDQLTIPLAAGLCVLTGETGAGKSIILDVRRPPPICFDKVPISAQ
jgi:DNA repair protein RecN (Recombination protein N)